MNLNTAIMLGFFVVLGALSWATHGFQGLLEGFKGGVDTLRNVWPLLLLALGIAGFLQVVIPRELISGALGPSSGFKGYFIGWGVGAVMPGAPYTLLPVAGSLLKAGAGIGPIMAMVLSAGIGVAVTRIPLEIAFIGWRFSVLRIMVCFLIPLVFGVFARYLAQWLGFFAHHS
jgi:uncharacterized membrane protein YraQ (UPF0718 family)